MGSTEVVDVSVKKANFSQTCSLLSQSLMKGNGGFLGLSQNWEHKVVPTGTMNLLSMIEKSDPESLNSPFNIFQHLAGVGGSRETMNKSDFSCGTKWVAESAPLTIFYAGQVMVFNDFPADKANEIMMLASKSSAAATQNHHFSSTAPPIKPPSPTESATRFPNVVPTLERAHRTPPPPKFASDLPIARKNSLARFLEKRKDRTTATTPYPVGKQAAQNNETWLRLGPELPSQIRRNN